jgi:predicted DNA-binding transcriptional regulator YafY
MTAARLARELEVSRRTILRDIDALSFAGVPVYAEGGHGGGISLDENYRTSLTGLKETELRTLFISSNKQLFDEIGLGEAAESAWRKLTAALPAGQQTAVRQVQQRFYIDPIWWWHDSEPLPFWEVLQQAIFEDRMIHTTYERYSGEVVERVLEPYSLVAKGNLWYLIAKRGEQLRIYRVSRFKKITLLNPHFQRPFDFDLAAFWQEHVQEFAETLSAYSLTLKIHPSRLDFAKRLTPGRFKIIDQPAEDGWHTVHFQLESVDLAKMLVFGLGKQVVVVEPRNLVRMVIDAALEVVEIHS